MSLCSQAGLNDAQIALQEMTLEFARRELAPLASLWDRDKIFPVETLRAAASLGMAAIYVREELGGAGLSRHDAALIFESLSTGCPAIAAYLSIHNMCAGIIDAYGSFEQQRRRLPQLVTMETLTSYCLTEPACGSDAAALRTKAVKDDEFYYLTGEKQFISGAGAGGDAHLYIVMARTGEAGPRGISAFLVEGDAPGMTLGANERKMGWNAQPTRSVSFQDCRVPVSNLLGKEGDGFKIAMSALDGGRLNIGACSLGGAARALAAAREYVQQREAFGRRLSEFQSLQFRLADMATELEAARALLWRAAAALDSGHADATRLCAMAKRIATDTGFSVVDDALQLFGGYGYLADYGVEKLLRDLRVHRILEGTNEIMRLIVARELLEERNS
ncbi:isobutyryl-CoA dehydrogenase [freshwater sediment metagenome]|uniref:Isobutyryl-CoA dehydrogenase n=1 Tax=freshwater sediment metagenome TaxID=556182 RepID=A0AA48RF55_9ZZZZ